MPHKELKEQYLTYFQDVPIQKYAAMAICRDEDTIIRWKKDDPNFADAIQRAKAEWIRKRVLASKAEFALERLAREVFSPSSSFEMEPRDEQKTGHDYLREIAETVRKAYSNQPPSDPTTHHPH